MCKISDKETSHVSGYFTHGGFTGKISVHDEETFYIEQIENQTQKATIIYKEQDLIQNYTKCAHAYSPSPLTDRREKHRRRKRFSSSYNSCPVLVAADSMFFKHVGKRSVSTTLAKMAYHISEADKIFRKTMFFKGQRESIGLVIASLIVYEDQESEGW